MFFECCRFCLFALSLDALRDCYEPRSLPTISGVEVSLQPHVFLFVVGFNVSFTTNPLNKCNLIVNTKKKRSVLGLNNSHLRRPTLCLRGRKSQSQGLSASSRRNLEGTLRKKGPFRSSRGGGGALPPPPITDLPVRLPPGRL